MIIYEEIVVIIWLSNNIIILYKGCTNPRVQHLPLTQK